MKKNRTSEQRKAMIDRLANMRDEDIDTSDIPEISEERFRTAVRGMFYRPVKRPITIRLDADIVEWLKQDGRGYQTKANRLLRFEMLKSRLEKKPAHPSQSAAKKRRKSGT